MDNISAPEQGSNEDESGSVYGPREKVTTNGGGYRDIGPYDWEATDDRFFLMVN